MESLLACAGTAAVTGGAWLGVLLLIDHHRKEKGSGRDLLISFGLGCASVPLALLLYRFAPDVLSGFNSPAAQLASWELLIVGPTEEFSKFLIFLLIMVWRRPAHEPMDGMLHAAAVALAFSLVENIRYGLDYGAETTALRGIVSTSMHLSFAAVWGFAYTVLIHSNLRRRPRDYVVLFFCVYPAAVLHGLSNLLVFTIDQWALLSDFCLFVGAATLLAWLQSKSPFESFGLAEAFQVISQIETGLVANPKSYPLNLRAAVARVVIGDYRRARGHIDRCLKASQGRALAISLSGVISFLEGQPDRGEKLLSLSYASLSLQHQRTIAILIRNVVRSPRTDNAYNEFLLSMWLKERTRVPGAPSPKTPTGDAGKEFRTRGSRQVVR